MSTVKLIQSKRSESTDVSSLFEPYVWAWFEDTFKEPSPPQVASWPKIAEGKNTLIFSPTGSGKTLAAFLWCINDLFKMGSQKATVYGEVPLQDSIYVLYISPLKALNNDIQKNLVEPLRGIKRYAKVAGINVPDVRSEVRTGDTSQKKRAEMARRPPQILITTPESLFIILSTQKFREALRTVKYVIVDEIHAMSDNKRGVHLSLSLERLQEFVKDDFVRIGLSATQKPLDEIAKFLVGIDGEGRPRDCEIVDIGARKDLNVEVISPVDNLLEAHFDAIWGSSYAKMISMINDHDTTLIFTNSRYKTERTALRLNELSDVGRENGGAGERGSEEARERGGDGASKPFAVGAHHGSMSKRVRLEMENKLKKGELDSLVATSSLELGIDVGSIDLVCQIQSPKSVSKGMQRIGRAGHLLDATSEGRLLVTDRDDLVESAVLVKAIMDGQIDTTRVPTNCLDVLAQHIVGAVAADDWEADDLFSLCRQSYCYRDLKREDFDRALDMLVGNYSFDMERAPYPKISWDKVNNVLSPERSARMISFRSSGTIPDIADYDVYFEGKKTKVGQLDEGFVEELHVGDIFILGSSSWHVLGIERNRVIVEDVYGKAPTIPFWFGDRDSRTYDLGVLVGQFRRKMNLILDAGYSMLDKPESSIQHPASSIQDWLQREYYVNENGAKSIYEYFREQQLVTGDIPSDELVMIEHFHNELGQQQIVIHSCFGIRVNDPWAMALCQAIEEKYAFRPQDATVDDGILITLPQGKEIDVGATHASPLLDLVTPDNVDELLERAILNSPVFSSRFRHNAVRALLVLREYRGRKTPVWLQNLRASALLEACRDDKDFPVMAETFRECMNEALDVPDLRKVLSRLASGEIEVKTLETKIPSPFTHSLLLLGQYGDMGSIPTRERRSRMMHLHRELLRQILDEETLRNLLDEEAVENVDSRLQHIDPQRKARNANEVARILLELGDLVDIPDDEISLPDRAEGDAHGMLSELVSAHRAVLVSIPTAETNRERWISTENFPLYRAAFAMEIELDDTDDRIVQILAERGPLSINRLAACSTSQILIPGDVEKRIEKLINGYMVLRLPVEQAASLFAGSEVEYVAAKAWIPEHILEERMSRQEARMTLIQKFMRWHGPVTKYEIMERYGFPDKLVESALVTLHEEGSIAKGEYVPTKSFPQWCYKSNLEEIHRLTLNRLRKEMEPTMPEEYADFLIRWQHIHPDTQLSGIDGLREVIGQIRGQENFQAVFERDVFPSRVRDYDPSMLDRLCYSGEVFWRRFEYRSLKRGQIGFYFREDRDWIVADPNEVEMELNQWDDDIPEACDAVRDYLRENGACFFGDIVKGTDLDWRLVLRAIWHLVWTGETTNDGFESIRHASFTSGLSGCYDLFKKPGRKGATIDYIVKHMLEYRRLDPTLGRWAPTERLVPYSLVGPDTDKKALEWATLLLKRYGIVSRECLKREVSPALWKDIRRALVKMELLGKVRRGFFVQELSGEQYAYPEAVDALREAKLRHPDEEMRERESEGASIQHPASSIQYPASSIQYPVSRTDEPMILLNSCDPANPFTAMFPTTNEVGEEVRFSRNPHKYMVVQAGQPILLYQGSITVLTDLSKERAEEAIKALMQIIDSPAKVETYKEIHIRDWNGHPIDVSPARHLLTKLGFLKGGSRGKGFVYDGYYKPDEEAPAYAGVARAEEEVPELFERAGKEKAPVKYDAEWIISRSNREIRGKVRELIELLERILPKECEFVYRPRDLSIRYRGIRCIHPYIQQKQIRLQITHRGWTPGIPVDSDTDLNAPEFISEVLGRFEKARQQIDSQLDTQQGLVTGE
jgi:ATP-dependent Lhr-like helicase